MIQLQDFSGLSSGLDSLIMPEANNRRGLAQTQEFEPQAHRYPDMFSGGSEPFFMDPANAAQEGPDTFTVPRTNTDVLDGNKYINDQTVDGRMYNPYTKKYGNKAFRNNNQGNITGMSGNLLYGASRIARSKHGDAGDRGQLVFDTPKQGWQAMYSLMKSDRYNNAPIRQAFSKYQSDQKAWSNMLHNLEVAGIDTKSKFNSLPMKQKLTFMNQRAKHEGWTGAPLTLADLS